MVVTDNLQAAQGKKFKIGPATFNIDSVGTTGNKQHEIKITYNEDSNEMSYDWNRLQAVQQRVELQDASGKPVPGFTLADSQEIIGDHIARVVTWKSGSSVASLAGKPARLRFVMKDADLYSIRFRN